MPGATTPPTGSSSSTASTRAGASRAGPRLLDAVVLRDPDRRISWTILCDPASGTRLPDFSFNRMPSPPPACGSDPSARLLTGFDLDPESLVLAPDGSFWISEEFGPFLLHVAADGRLLEPPVQVPGVRSPQNPFLDLGDRARPERPTLAASRGFEGLAIAPDGGTLYALLEGAVAGDDPQDLRIYVYRLATRTFDPGFLRLRLEAPSQQVDLAQLVDPRGERVYPGAVVPPKGPVSIGEIKAVDDHRFLVIERDNLGDDERAPRFKKVFLVDAEGAAERGGYVAKTLLLDLLALPDPGRDRRRRRFLPPPLLHDRVGPRRRRPHAPGRLRQQLPRLERARAQPRRRSPGAARRRSDGARPGAPRRPPRRRPPAPAASGGPAAGDPR